MYLIYADVINLYYHPTYADFVETHINQLA